MMKENLLCVAQCEQDGKWYMGYPFHDFEKDQWYGYVVGMALPVPVLEYTISRCVGRRDCYGDLIFEGCMLDIHGADVNETYHAIVKWDEWVCGWGLLYKGQMRKLELRYWDSNDIRIVGHIHENTGLLREWGYQPDGTWSEKKAPIVDAESEEVDG